VRLADWVGLRPAGCATRGEKRRENGLGRDVGWLRSARGRSERAGHVGCAGYAGKIKEERMLGWVVLVWAGFRL
jgi:hypothetical protein